MCDIVVFSKTLAGENCVFNITLRGGSLTTDVNETESTPENGYAVECFFERMLQSNTQIMVDDNLELTLSITCSKSGGVYRKLLGLAHN